jgi:4'-phosphopantetheinyl transferase EntD
MSTAWFKARGFAFEPLVVCRCGKIRHHGGDIMTHSTDLPSDPDASQDGCRSARIAPEVAALFPAGVVAAQLLGEADPALLHPAESQAVQNVAPRRLMDYAAGRECARLALRHLGIEGFPLLSAGDRRPLWPEGIAGSITHTRGCCIAAVARSYDVRSLGLDAEVVAAVHQDLWRRICCPQELEWLARQPPDQQMPVAALIFAAKESFYKCQYPLTGEWLGFDDVLIEATVEGTLLARPQRPIKLDSHVAGPLAGRYRYHDGWVTAAMAIP